MNGAAPLRIYIVRHGKADQDSPTGMDRDRPLLPRGVEQAKWLGARLASAPARPAFIATSPYARAIETARLIQAAVACPLDTETSLQTGRRATEAAREVERLAAAGPLVVVGHNPQLEDLIELLTGSEVVMRTGQAAVVDLDAPLIEGAGRLVECLRCEED